MLASGADEPSPAEQKARPQRCQKDWTGSVVSVAVGSSKNGIKCYPARGRAEIAERARDNRKLIFGDIQLFCEERNQARIGLMRRQALHRRSGDAASMFDIDYHLL